MVSLRADLALENIAALLRADMEITLTNAELNKNLYFMKNKKKCVAFPSKPQLHGGPGSFQIRFEEALKQRGWKISYGQQKALDKIDVIVVIAATKRLFWLIREKLKGVPIIQRLDGVLWQHKFENKGLWLSKIKPFIYQSLTTFIYRFIADGVVYQSEFIRQCWYRHLNYEPGVQTVIHNAVDLKQINPGISRLFGTQFKRPKLICVEGEVQDSDANIEPLIGVGIRLLDQHLISGVTVIGDISPAVRQRLEQAIPSIDIKGRLSRDETLSLYPGSIYLVLEINAPCPNSVIEAMALGCPVVGFDSGALAELVPPVAGEIVPYDGDPWNLDVPDANKLFKGILKVLGDYSTFSNNARKVALQRYDLEKMTESYILTIEKILSRRDSSRHS